MKNILEELNKEQLQAVKATEGYIRVVAGAGSGKTKVLTTRYIYLAKKLGISPDHILCVTFTNKAAQEMRSRVQKHMPDESGGWITTFHGACNKILRDDINCVSYPKNFMILDEDDASAILKKIYAKHGFTLRDMKYKQALEMIAKYKHDNQKIYINYLTDPSKLKEIENLNDNHTPNIIIREYLEEQRKNFYLDFSDLLYFVLYIFAENSEIRKKWQNHFEYIQVDEFQDVTASEYALVQILSQRHENLFVVGDPDQTIYSFRGADVKIFLNFNRDFKNAKTIILSKNYRSTPEILNVSNSLIKHNRLRIEKELTATKETGMVVHYHHAQNSVDECAWIADKILEIVNQDDVPYNEIAILYRSSYITRSIEEALLKKKIPYIIYNGFEFFKRAEIKTAICYLRMLIFGDDLSFERTINNPPRKIGRTRMAIVEELSKQRRVSYYETLKALVESHDYRFEKTLASQYIAILESGKEKMDQYSIADILDYMLVKSGFEEQLMTDGDQERLDNLKELKSAVLDYVNSANEETDLRTYLNMLSLITNADRTDKRNAIKMMTVHTAKGLEFPYVFVCGLNESIFPTYRITCWEEMEEERRLAYVAYTRAQKRLFLTDAEGFNERAGRQRYPSRFIFNIGNDLLDCSGVVSDETVEISLRFIEENEHKLLLNEKREIGEFDIGDEVEHEVFGRGIIIDKGDFNYTVEFPEKIR